MVKITLRCKLLKTDDKNCVAGCQGFEPYAIRRSPATSFGSAIADDGDLPGVRTPFGLGKRAAHLRARAEQLEEFGSHFTGEDRLESVSSGEGRIRKPESGDTDER